MSTSQNALQNAHAVRLYELLLLMDKSLITLAAIDQYFANRPEDAELYAYWRTIVRIVVSQAATPIFPEIEITFEADDDDSDTSPSIPFQNAA